MGRQCWCSSCTLSRRVYERINSFVSVLEIRQMGWWAGYNETRDGGTEGWCVPSSDVEGAENKHDDTDLVELVRVCIMMRDCNEYEPIKAMEEKG